MFYDFILKTIICKSLIFIKTISTPKTISKSLIFLILIYQLLLIKLNFKIYLTRVGARPKVASARPGERRPAKPRRAGAEHRPPRCGRRAALTSRDAVGWADGPRRLAGGGAGERAGGRRRLRSRAGIKWGVLPQVGPAVGTYRQLIWR